jgi:uncharacterized protein YdaU (DUF1376 family)
MNSPPAFQFYAADWLADADVTMMTLEEEGAYIRALAFCWREGSIPADEKRLSVLLKGGSRDVLAAVKQRFKISPSDPQRLVHGRLDLERKKQKEWREKSSEAGKKSGKIRREKKLHNEPTLNSGSYLVEPKANSTSSSLFSSSFSSPTTEKTKKQKTSKPKTEKPVDQRRLDFIEDLSLHWKSFAKTKFVFDGADGTQTDLFLKAWPDLTREQWRNCMRNRRNSPGVIPTQRIYLWVSRLGEYLNSPLNEYKQPVNGDGGLNAGLLNGKGGHNLGLSRGFDREEEYSGRALEDGDIQGN